MSSPFSSAGDPASLPSGIEAPVAPLGRGSWLLASAWQRMAAAALVSAALWAMTGWAMGWW